MLNITSVEAGVPKTFCAEAVNYASYIIKHIATKDVKKESIRNVAWVYSDVRRFKIFRCTAMCHVRKQSVYMSAILTQI